MTVVRSRLALGAALAIAVASLAGVLSVRRLNDTIAMGGYYADSAGYRLQAAQLADVRRIQGLTEAVELSLRSKDSLDLTVRLIAAPWSLTRRAGHLVVLVPMMAGFLFLLYWLVHDRSGSAALACAAAVAVLALPLATTGYYGIADYWKDNLAAWLVGSAVVAWIMSDGLKRAGWSLLWGASLGLLLMQRTSTSVYIALLFLPLVAFRLVRILVQPEGRRRSTAVIATAFLPGVVAALLVAGFQWASLREYYFETGYGYTNRSGVVAYLRDTPIRSVARVSLLGLAVVAAFALYRISDAPPHRRDAVTAGWMVLGFPVSVVALRGLNHGFWSVWAVVVLTAAAVAISGRLRHPPRPVAIVSCGLVLAALCWQGGQWAGSHVAGLDRAAYAQTGSSWRQLEMRIGDIVLSRPAGPPYALLFDERSVLVANFMFYERGGSARPHLPIALVHSSYYRARYDTAAAERIVPRLVGQLEAQRGTLSFGHCDPARVLELPDIVFERRADPRGRSLAADVLIGLNGHVLDSPQWRVLERLEAAGTCLYAYELADRPLSPEEKWRMVADSARPAPVSRTARDAAAVHPSSRFT